MTTILIAGANRGIGLEFARQYAMADAQVLAGCRAPDQADALQALARDHADRVEIFPLDVTRDESVAAAGRQFADRKIDLLIVNAGVSGQRDAKLGHVDYDSFEETLAVNTIAPYRVIDGFIDHVRAGGDKKIIIISSQLGSITNCSGGGVFYRTSKAAVNMVARTLAKELTEEGIIICPIHPGWVRTDMGGSNATLSVEESVAGMRDFIAGATPTSSGRFYQWDGQELPW